MIQVIMLGGPFTHAESNHELSEEIDLTLSPNTELRFLIDLASQQLGMNILYDETINNKRVTLKMQGKMTKANLLQVLQSALEMKGLMLVDDQAGWKRVVQIKSLSNSAEILPDIAMTEERADYDAVTWFYQFKYAGAQASQVLIKPILSQPGGNVNVLVDQNAIIVTDFSSRIEKVQQILGLFDRPGRETVVEFLNVEHADAAQLAQQVTKLLAQKKQISGGAGVPQQETVAVLHEDRMNQLIVLGVPDAVAEVTRFATSLDRVIPRSVKVYRLKFTQPDSLSEIIHKLIKTGSARHQKFEIVADDKTMSLIVVAVDQMHESISELIGQFDVEADFVQRPIRSYKLNHADAEEVLGTIQSLHDRGFIEQGIVGVNGQAIERNAESNILQDAYSLDSGVNVTADKNTNSILVMGPLHVHQVYEQLISLLDKRRPQVLVECTVVTLDKNDNESLGVELGGEVRLSHGIRSQLFSSFGLGEVNAETGEKAFIPGPGFNGTLINTDVVDLLVKALATTGKSKILAMPRLLVNDNATGKIDSINEAPFTSVNASDTVSTTSFGGYESAGTQISVTPHIAEGDHLRLEYNITLNSFSGESSNGNPPPRQTNTITSEVTVPDGYTIVVGGVRRFDQTESKSAVPILGELPILEYLFSSQERGDSQSVIYVFLRPIILRDDDFSDLKYFSSKSLRQAELDEGYPSSQPLLMQ
ncbi:secretin N-terminal domain-containing protein [Poriferisphaera sp. WC338]|uniref:secretin N-terminal domain-containing protein n=1 Tax=Poriferisphaera sp. WC338 TaxID=3425129 RepID=UPI003D813CC0